MVNDKVIHLIVFEGFLIVRLWRHRDFSEKNIKARYGFGQRRLILSLGKIVYLIKLDKCILKKLLLDFMLNKLIVWNKNDPTITLNTNLVSNIRFSDKATYTKNINDRNANFNALSLGVSKHAKH